MIVNSPVGSNTAATGVILGAGDPTLIVMPSGLVYNTSNGYAIEMTSDSNRIINSGEIYATSVAVRATGTFNAIVNNGVIESQIQFASASGSNTIENHGTITTFGLSFAISGSATSTEILENDGIVADTISQIEIVRNRGRIEGSVFADTTTGLTLSNFGGTITGSVAGGSGTDSIDLRGGTVLGNVSGNTGDDIFIIDADSSTGIERLFGGSGTDTLNVSNSGTAFWIDLTWAGSHVWTSGTSIATGGNANTAIATLDNFENIVGTPGTDSVFGNAKSNVYTWNGNAPRETFTFDTFNGREGIDTIDVSLAPSIWADLTNPIAQIFSNDTTTSFGFNASTLIAAVSNVENIIGTRGSDQVFGDAADNSFSSNGIALGTGVLDRFDGRGGSDTIDFSKVTTGGLWIHFTWGGFEAYTSLTSSATLYNSNVPFADLVSVENVVDTIFSDTFVGDGLNNTYGFTGYTFGVVESTNGADGNDTYDASRYAFSIWIDLAAGLQVFTSFTAVSTDANSFNHVADLISFENIVGTAFTDTLKGDGNANRINGGRGSDFLTGRGGNDTFVIQQLTGVETINDLAYGSGVGDVVEISGFSSVTNFTQLFAAASQVGADTLVNLGFDSDSTVFSQLILKNVTKAGLAENDFVFLA